MCKVLYCLTFMLSKSFCFVFIKECFYLAFETEVHYTISQANLFQPGDYVAIGASGGKDSTVLAYIMKTLNDRLEFC